MKKKRVGHLVVGVFFAFIIGFGNFINPDTTKVFWQTISDAYIGVSVFVGFVLMLFYGVEYFTNFKSDQFFNRYRKWQVPVSAALGVLPGCGGAIMVITQYVAGRLGFGSVVAVLTSTMGDAAFLLIAKEPETALMLFIFSFFVGVISGYAVELIHGYDFLRGEVKSHRVCVGKVFDFGVYRFVWLGLFFPGLILGIIDAFNYDIKHLFNFDLVYWGGLLGGVISIIFWFVAPYSYPQVIQKGERGASRKYWNQIIADTNFVTMWVVLSFLIFELTVLWTGFDFSQFFKGVAVFTPLIATLVGFLPGCGPQIIVTTLYLQGLIPLSAQISNAISNDGDALFPAIALAPKVAVYATLYTAIPALVFGYIWYFLFDK